jgi:hypothetical protein
MILPLVAAIYPGSLPSHIDLRILEKRTLMSLGFSSPGTLKAFETSLWKEDRIVYR